MPIKISKGLTIPIAGEPEQVIENGPSVTQVALLGTDYLDLKPTLLVNEGDRVKLGQPLFSDRRQPQVLFTSPASGIVKAIERGHKRVLQAVTIIVDDKDECTFETFNTKQLAQLDREQVVNNLIASGLWTAFRTRPYSKIPAVDSQPHSIFVTAIDTNPLAANPAVVINQFAEDFAFGLDVISNLTTGRTFVCHGDDYTPITTANEKIRFEQFNGGHPAGLPGTHIHFLDPIIGDKTVWHIGYQDVIAIGKLFTTGKLWVERIVALAGPNVLRPRLMKTRLGAATEQLVAEELTEGSCRVVSGSILAGHRAVSWASYLGRYHTQISVLAEDVEREFFGWLSPGGEKFSALKVLWEGISKQRKLNLSTLQNGSPRAIIPLGTFEEVMPLDILATPLLKALVVGDTDMAQKLGCLELDEEDLALCSFVCPGKTEFGRALRHCLIEIERNG